MDAVKSKRTKSKGPPVANAPPAPALAVRPARRWFRCVALLSPLLLCGLAEFGLRLAGVGYATSFFLPAREEGRAVLVENPRFGWRFFPAAVARSPQPLSLPARKPPDTLRLFVLGESAAMGDPEPAYGFARQVERLLRARHPDRKVEVVNAAMTAINSHVIREIARDCAPQAGDVWLIYAGNNEVVGPFGAGTVFGRQAPRLAVVRAILAWKATRLSQFFSGLIQRFARPTEWEGMEMFLQQQVHRDDPRLGRVYQSFAANLDAIVQLGRQSGAEVLLATVPVNLRDCPPFGSMHRAGLDAAGRREWEQCFARGVKAETERRFADALAAYQQAALSDADFAELAFRRARCELALGQTAAAQADFRLARDLDTLRFRADSRLNEIIRQTAAARRVPLVDAEAECARRSPDGLPGDNLFYDHVHLNFAGNYAVATLFAAAVEQALSGAAPSAREAWLAENEVGRRLAFTDFNRERVGEEMQARLRQPPFASQLNFPEREAQWQRRLAALHTAPTNFVADYRAAVALAPEDWLLHAHFGRLLEAAGDASGATAQWQEVRRLLPHEPDAWFHLGDLAYTAARYAEADALFREALQRRPDATEALNGRGLADAALGRTREAARQFETALHLKPRFTAARVNLALLLAKGGRTDRALAQYREALRLDTNNVGARIDLAKLLAGLGRTDEALALYEEAARLQPDNAVAQFNLGNALVARGRHAEARPHYAAAVQARPDFAEARANLGVEWARQGNLREALAQFAEVVRLQPDSAAAHFNYGIALAQEQRYAEAARQFQETLRLDPSHPSARPALQRALQLGGGSPGN